MYMCVHAWLSGCILKKCARLEVEALECLLVFLAILDFLLEEVLLLLKLLCLELGIGLSSALPSTTPR